MVSRRAANRKDTAFRSRLRSLTNMPRSVASFPSTRRKPFAALVWKLNFLYLPSLTILCINLILFSFWFDKPYHVTTIGAKRASMDLVKPHYWALTELGLVMGYFPAALLAGLMRVIYVMCVALLGVLRVDTSLLPTGLQSFDSPYYCFAAYALRLNKASAPLLLTAVDMLRTGVVRRTEDATSAVEPGTASSSQAPTAAESAAVRRRRVRNRLHLALTLGLFPMLIPLRKHHLEAKRARAESRSKAAEEVVKEKQKHSMSARFARAWAHKTPASADGSSQAPPQQAAHDAAAATKPDELHKATAQDHTVAQI